MERVTPPETWLDFLRWQAEQTRDTCRYLARRCSMRQGLLLDLACGRGDISAWLAGTRPELTILGLDHDLAVLPEPGGEFTPVCGAVDRLPLNDAVADYVLFHFALMWVETRNVLAEVRRVLKPGGWMLVCAEPDYSGMISEPDPGDKRTMVQRLTRGIERVSGDPYLGSKLPRVIKEAGFMLADFGLSSRPRLYTREEWNDLERVFSFRTYFHPRSGPRWRNNLKRIIRKRPYLEFMPVFYALAQR